MHLDKRTKWAGSYHGDSKGASGDDASTVDLDDVTVTITAADDKGRYLITAGATTAIATAIKNHDGDEVLTAVNTTDEGFGTIYASKIKDKKVRRFQSIRQTPGTDALVTIGRFRRD